VIFIAVQLRIDWKSKLPALSTQHPTFNEFVIPSGAACRAVAMAKAGGISYFLTAAYTDFPRRISSAYWRSNNGQLFSCSFVKQKAATR
jgi:hypothetical protein